MSGAPTLVAVATPWGPGALGVVRLSGPGAFPLLGAVCPGPLPPPRAVRLRTVRDADGAPLDRALVTVFPAARSPTGEDLVELSLTGNPVLLHHVVDLLTQAGATPAGPGAFARQSALHGRLGLLGLEALAARHAATSVEGLRVAGAPPTALPHALREGLLDVAAALEFSLDHPEEADQLVPEAALADRLDALAAEAAAAAAGWTAARLRIEGARVAVTGPPNAGKSTLINTLIGQDRLLVDAAPGTTRDAVELPFRLRGLALTLVDTAGLRAAADPVEARGVALGATLAAAADLRLHLVPLDAPLPAVLPADGPADLPVGSRADCAAPPATWPAGWPCVSARTGAGLDALQDAIYARLGALVPTGARLALHSARQHEACCTVARACRDAAAALRGPAGPAVAAEAATEALDALFAWTGEHARDAVLDRLFARFCVGK
jgi:tRNA modification GTPase